ncbi:MAG: adenine deaminase C-terminal domain-containing protein, partial [Candidatus Thorarchaeota archaeon]
RGHLVAREGKMIADVVEQQQPRLRRSVNIHWLEPEDFEVRANGKLMNVIGVIPHQIVTKHLVEEPRVKGEMVVPDVDRDLVKVAVIERHNASPVRAVGFVRGLGIKEGAMVSSVAHDSHNIVTVATNDRDLVEAAVQVARMQGGLAVVRDGEVLASLALPIAGLMSDRPIEEVSERLERLRTAAERIGCDIDEPFMAMAFLTLPVIPELKITDIGLVDVVRFRTIGLFEVPQNDSDSAAHREA